MKTKKSLKILHSMHPFFMHLTTQQQGGMERNIDNEKIAGNLSFNFINSFFPFFHLQLPLHDSVTA